MRFFLQNSHHPGPPEFNEQFHREINENRENTNCFDGRVTSLSYRPCGNLFGLMLSRLVGDYAVEVFSVRVASSLWPIVTDGGHPGLKCLFHLGLAARELSFMA
ncbi:hypothetical protein BaRGS_00006798 [Batillaria attramentaria]|uniref:Uncharacterized protein n=1 Tax=Batillaria attramentaria TaxID=370345 RepID=A0ABD0LRD4_9CAEN